MDLPALTQEAIRQALERGTLPPPGPAAKILSHGPTQSQKPAPGG